MAGRWAHRLRVVEALVLVVLASVLRRLVPMRRWAPILGAKGPVSVAGQAAPLAGSEACVARAVTSAARRTSANCLDQAVAASVMLRVRGRSGVVVIGLDRERPTDVPHAWLVGRSGAVVVGGDLMGRFRAVSQFGAFPPLG